MIDAPILPLANGDHRYSLASLGPKPSHPVLVNPSVGENRIQDAECGGKTYFIYILVFVHQLLYFRPLPIFKLFLLRA